MLTLSCLRNRLIGSEGDEDAGEWHQLGGPTSPPSWVRTRKVSTESWVDDGEPLTNEEEEAYAKIAINEQLERLYHADERWAPNPNPNPIPNPTLTLTLTLTLTRLASLRQYAHELSEDDGQHHHFPRQCSFDAALSAAPSAPMHLPGNHGGSNPNPNSNPNPTLNPTL